MSESHREGFEEGKAEGVVEGIGIGIEKGGQAKAIDIARKLKQLGIELSVIMKTTGLSAEEIAKL